MSALRLSCSVGIQCRIPQGTTTFAGYGDAGRGVFGPAVRCPVQEGEDEMLELTTSHMGTCVVVFVNDVLGTGNVTVDDAVRLRTRWLLSPAHQDSLLLNPQPPLSLRRLHIFAAILHRFSEPGSPRQLLSSPPSLQSTKRPISAFTDSVPPSPVTPAFATRF